MHMMRAASAERRHAFDEKEMVWVGVVLPEHVIECGQRRANCLAGPRPVGGDEEEVDDRFGSESRHSGAPHVLEPQPEPGWTQRRSDSFSFLQV